MTTIVTDVTEAVISAVETEDLLTTEARDVLRAAVREDLMETTVSEAETVPVSVREEEETTVMQYLLRS